MPDIKRKLHLVGSLLLIFAATALVVNFLRLYELPGKCPPELATTCAAYAQWKLINIVASATGVLGLAIKAFARYKH